MDCERVMGISKKALSTAMLTSQSVQLCKISLAQKSTSFFLSLSFYYSEYSQ
ncbi:hypothetical protein YC2023_116988 [Brassica napus]